MSVILLSIPGLREKDVAVMPQLREMTAAGQIVNLVPSFPCVTCPVQANMTTGRLPFGARRGGQWALLAAEAAGRDVDLAQRLHRAAADLGPAFARCAGGETPGPPNPFAVQWAGTSPPSARDPDLGGVVRDA